MNEEADIELTTFPWLSPELRQYVLSLYRVQYFFSSLTEPDQLLVRITEECVRACDAESGSLLLYNEQKKELTFEVTLGPVGDNITKKEIKLPLGCGIAGEVAQTRKSIIVNEVRSHPQFFDGVDTQTQYITRNLIAVPLIERKKLLGVIEVINKKNNQSFTKEDLRFLEILASFAASAVHTSQLIQDKINNERFAALGYTLTALAHHLKNILTGLQTSTELIDKSIQQGKYEVLSKAWPVFRRTSFYIYEFVQDLLIFSKPRIPQKKTCLVDEIINRVTDFFTDLFSSREVRLEIKNHIPGKTIFVDPTGITHCLTNLIINAIEAVPEKDGIIELTLEKDTQQDLQITVYDNGSGIPVEELPQIFEPFYTTKGYRGTGLGLAVTKKIIEEHGGSIQVISAPKAGTKFIIHIPQPTS